MTTGEIETLFFRASTQMKILFGVGLVLGSFFAGVGLRLVVTTLMRLRG